MAKLIATDNYARESIADIVVAENLTQTWAEYLAAAANEHNPGDRFFRAEPDDYKPWGGMKELV